MPIFNDFERVIIFSVRFMGALQCFFFILRKFAARYNFPMFRSFFLTIDRYGVITHGAVTHNAAVPFAITLPYSAMIARMPAIINR